MGEEGVRGCHCQHKVMASGVLLPDLAADAKSLLKKFAKVLRRLYLREVERLLIADDPTAHHSIVVE